MEIQTIQSAVAGVYRITEFLAKNGEENMKETMPDYAGKSEPGKEKDGETDTGDKRKEKKNTEGETCMDHGDRKKNPV